MVLIKEDEHGRQVHGKRHGRVFEKFFPYMEKALAFIQKVRYSKKITVLSFYKL